MIEAIKAQLVKAQFTTYRHAFVFQARGERVAIEVFERNGKAVCIASCHAAIRDARGNGPIAALNKLIAELGDAAGRPGYLSAERMNNCVAAVTAARDALAMVV